MTKITHRTRIACVHRADSRRARTFRMLARVKGATLQAVQNIAGWPEGRPTLFNLKRIAHWNGCNLYEIGQTRDGRSKYRVWA